MTLDFKLLENNFKLRYMLTISTTHCLEVTGLTLDAIEMLDVWYIFS